MRKIKIRLVKIVSNKNICKNCQANCKIDNDEFPELIAHLGMDDCKTFMVSPDGNWWNIDDFIFGFPFSQIWVDESELNA